MYLEGISENTRVIGTVTNPSLEAIAALSPDMVLLSSELPTHKKLAEDLESRGISSRMISVNSFSEYDQVMKEFTGMTGREDCYRKNVTDVRERIDQILQSASEKDQKRAPIWRCGSRRPRIKLLRMTILPARYLMHSGLKISLRTIRFLTS